MCRDPNWCWCRLVTIRWCTKCSRVARLCGSEARCCHVRRKNWWFLASNCLWVQALFNTIWIKTIAGEWILFRWMECCRLSSLLLLLLLVPGRWLITNCSTFASSIGCKMRRRSWSSRAIFSLLWVWSWWVVQRCGIRLLRLSSVWVRRRSYKRLLPCIFLLITVIQRKGIFIVWIWVNNDTTFLFCAFVGPSFFVKSQIGYIRHWTLMGIEEPLSGWWRIRFLWFRRLRLSWLFRLRAGWWRPCISRW